ncbi:MAG: hypothetical protein MUF87_18515 [Anaerolineae bacterium]|jgi:hypothetical protein|nr:hypothetical protein [Anaerolineae bacterium]
MHRIRALVTTFLLLTLLIGLLHAQDPCGGLDAEDCAILSGVPSAMTALNAARFDLTLDFSGPEAANATLTLDGAYQLDTSTALLTGLDSELNLTLTLSEALSSFGISDVTLNLALVDGIGYLNFDTLDPATGGMFSAGGYTGWGGIELMPIVSEMDPMILTQPLTSLTQTLSLDSFADVQPYLTITRTADQNGLAVFEASFDTNAMMDDPVLALRFRDGLLAVLGSAGQDEIDLMMDVFRNSTISALIRVDPATSQLHGLELTWNADFGNILSAMEGVDAPAPVTLTVTLNVSEFDSASVTAPENASIGTPEDLQNLFGPFFSFGVN